MASSMKIQEAGRFLLAALAMVALGCSVWLAMRDRVPAGTLMAVLGLLLLAFVQLSRFKHIKGLGFEAELWESKQEEAAELIDQTRALLKILSAAMLRAAPRMGRMMSGFNRRELLALATEVGTSLKSAGITSDDFEAMRDEIDRIIAWDLAEPITDAIRHFVFTRAGEVRSENERAFGSPITDLAGYTEAHNRLHDLNMRVISPNDLAKVPRTAWAQHLREHILDLPLTDTPSKERLLVEQDEALKDLNAWTTGRTIRREDVFYGADPTAS